MSEIPIYSIKNQPVELGGFKLYSIKSDKSDKIPYPGFPQKTTVPHRHDFFEVFVFFRGEGIHEIDFNKVDIKDRSIHFVAPGQVHLISDHENAEGYMLAFTEQFIELNRKLINLNIRELPQSFLNLSEDDFQFVPKILDEIMHEYSHSVEESEEVIRSFLYIFLLKIKGMYRGVKLAHGIISRDSKFKSFEEFVERDYLKNQQVNYYADLLHISPSHLNKISKRFCGKTASDFIHDRVMLEAKRLLVFSDKSSKEIAYHLMYDDPSYFSRIFKKKTGYSPTEFKKQKLEMYQPEA
ncbi:MAG: helix-turn-helix domain-containing protein [Cyclobacteriaceae bacterium]